MADNINFQPVFDFIENNNSKLAKVIEQRFKENNEELLCLMESKFSTKEDANRIMKVLDGIVSTVHKLDEERLVTVEWISG